MLNIKYRIISLLLVTLDITKRVSNHLKNWSFTIRWQYCCATLLTGLYFLKNWYQYQNKVLGAYWKFNILTTSACLRKHIRYYTILIKIRIIFKYKKHFLQRVNSIYIECKYISLIKIQTSSCYIIFLTVFHLSLKTAI